MKKILYFFILLLVISCHKHDEENDYVVSMTINSPTQNQAVNKNTALPIQIIITRPNQAIIHQIKIEIINNTKNTSETLVNKHYHSEGQVSFSKNDYILISSGNYTLKVTVTDDAGLQPNTKEVNFSVT